MNSVPVLSIDHKYLKIEFDEDLNKISMVIITIVEL